MKKKFTFTVGPQDRNRVTALDQLTVLVIQLGALAVLDPGN